METFLSGVSVYYARQCLTLGNF